MLDFEGIVQINTNMPRERESKTRGKREKEKEDDHGADEGGKDVNWL